MTKNSDHSIDLDYVAQLARIEIAPEQKPKIKDQLESILGYFEKISNLDVADVEPIAHPFPAYNAWQDDQPCHPFSPEEALQNAPEQRDNQVLVPKVVE